MRMIIIAAVAKNGVIGNSKLNGMPWHCSEDLKFFKKNTMGKIVVMGRKTAEQVGKLRERDCILVSRAPDFKYVPPQGFIGPRTVMQITYLANLDQEREYAICGGAEIYKQLMPYCQNAIISRMNFEAEGDILMPEFNEDWVETSKIKFEQFTAHSYFNTNVIKALPELS